MHIKIIPNFVKGNLCKIPIYIHLFIIFQIDTSFTSRHLPSRSLWSWQPCLPWWCSGSLPWRSLLPSSGSLWRRTGSLPPQALESASTSWSSCLWMWLVSFLWSRRRHQQRHNKGPHNKHCPRFCTKVSHKKRKKFLEGFAARNQKKAKHALKQ